MLRQAWLPAGLCGACGKPRKAPPCGRMAALMRIRSSPPSRGWGRRAGCSVQPAAMEVVSHFLPPWDLLPQKALEPAGVALPWEGLSSFAGSQQWGFPGSFRGLAVDPHGGRGLPVKGRWVRYGLRGQQRRPLEQLLACGGTGEGRPPTETPVLSSLSYQGVDNRRL